VFRTILAINSHSFPAQHPLIDLSHKHRVLREVRTETLWSKVHINCNHFMRLYCANCSVCGLHWGDQLLRYGLVQAGNFRTGVSPSTSFFFLLSIMPYPTSSTCQWRTQEFYSGGRVQQIQLRTERTGIWGQWSPSQGFWRQL
jgi:hypothetical protein